MQLRHVSTIGEKLVKQQYLFHMFSTAEIGYRVRGTPANEISTGFASWFRYRTDVAQRRSAKLCIVWSCSGLVHHIHFWGLLPPDGIQPGAKFTLRHVLRSPILAALLHGSRAVGVGQTFAAWYLHATGRPSSSTLGDRSV